MKSDEILAKILDEQSLCVRYCFPKDFKDRCCPDSSWIDNDFSCAKCWTDWARKQAEVDNEKR